MLFRLEELIQKLALASRKEYPAVTFRHSSSMLLLRLSRLNSTLMCGDGEGVAVGEGVAATTYTYM